jgi:hypothetical protein
MYLIKVRMTVFFTERVYCEAHGGTYSTSEWRAALVRRIRFVWLASGNVSRRFIVGRVHLPCIPKIFSLSLVTSNF